MKNNLVLSFFRDVSLKTKADSISSIWQIGCKISKIILWFTPKNLFLGKPQRTTKPIYYLGKLQLVARHQILRKPNLMSKNPIDEQKIANNLNKIMMEALQKDMGMLESNMTIGKDNKRSIIGKWSKDLGVSVVKNIVI